MELDLDPSSVAGAFPAYEATRPVTLSIPSVSPRLAWVDALRLLACFGVVLIHVSGQAYARFGTAPAWEWWLANGLNASSRAAVPLFAMLSGALLKAADGDAGRFYRRKLGRFLPVLAAWSGFYGAFDVGVLGLSPRGVALLFVSHGYVYLHLWYLSMFAMLLAFLPFLARFRFAVPLSPRDRRILLWAGVGLLCLDWGCAFASQAGGVTFIPWTRTFVAFIPYVLLGAWLVSPGTIRVNRRLCAGVLLGALILSWTANFLSCRYLGIIDDTAPLANHSPLVLAVAVSTFLLVRSAPGLAKSSGWLASSGECALGIYLLHPFFLWLGRRALRTTSLNPVGGAWMPLTAVVVFLASLGCILLLRRFAWGRRLC